MHVRARAPSHIGLTTVSMILPYAGEVADEVQKVSCDATGGSFRLSFMGEQTGDIHADDNAAEIEQRIEEVR